VAIAVEHDAQSQSDFVVGVYPGVRKTTPVPDDAPPMFLAITDDDVLVAPLSVARLYEEWRKANKPIELHIFTRGGHGFGMLKQNQPSDAWLDLFRNWLDAQGFPDSGESSAEIDATRLSRGGSRALLSRWAAPAPDATRLPRGVSPCLLN
jgi:acetyl esterase/lipase